MENSLLPRKLVFWFETRSIDLKTFHLLQRKNGKFFLWLRKCLFWYGSRYEIYTAVTNQRWSRKCNKWNIEYLGHSTVFIAQFQTSQFLSLWSDIQLFLCFRQILCTKENVFYIYDYYHINYYLFFRNQFHTRRYFFVFILVSATFSQI